MPARYQVLQHEKKPYWLANCPLLMVTHALTKDTANNTVFLQCKFQNLSDKKMKALNIRVVCFDVTGQPLTAVDSFSYLDVSIASDKTFGDQTPVSLPDRETRAFHVIPQKIVFVDNSIWENADNQPFVLAEYEQKRISSLGDLADQYKRDLHDICSKANAHAYLPTRKDGFTICGCGKIMLDSTKTCPACGVPIERMFALNNEEILALAKEVYEQNKLKREEQEKLQAAIEQEAQQQAKLQKQKQQFRIIKYVCIALVLCLGISTSISVYKNISSSITEKHFIHTLTKGIQTRSRLADTENHTDKELTDAEEDILKFKGTRFETEFIEEAATQYIDGLENQITSLYGTDTIQNESDWSNGYKKRSFAIRTLEEQGILRLTDEEYLFFAIESLRNDIINQMVGEFTFDIDNLEFTLKVPNSTKLNLKNATINVYWEYSNEPVTIIKDTWRSGEQWNITIPFEENTELSFYLDLQAELA